MVYPFTLPTTSHLSLQSSLIAPTHPSLPQAASTARHALRVALKTHKQLPHPQQDAHLPTVLTALTDYIPYIHALSAGLSDKPVETTSGTREFITVLPRADLTPEWRPTLSSPAAATATNRTRARGHNLDFEIAFVLTTLGYVLSGLARSGVTRTLYAASTPTADQRTAAVQSATRSLLQASAVHTLLASWPSPPPTNPTSPTPPDTNPATQTALAALALSEATLLAVLKDDSYVTACIQARNPNDRDWMVRAPEIPKVRAHLFARLCLRAAEYADQAAAGLGSVGAHAKAKAGVDDRLVRYVRVLSRVARARACRFFGVDAELAGRIGEGIAWLRAARGALGVPAGTAAGRKDRAEKAEKGGASGLDRLKQGWMERREERRLEKGAGGSREKSGELGPGDYAGREEEGRVIEMLETKWVRMNDTINTQLIPSSNDLLNSLPSGRDIHSPPGPYKLPALDDEQLAQMRAPPDDTGSISGESAEEGDEGFGEQVQTPGAYPERTDSAYY